MKADINNNGVIDSSEFMAALLLLGGNWYSKYSIGGVMIKANNNMTYLPFTPLFVPDQFEFKVYIPTQS